MLSPAAMQIAAAALVCGLAVAVLLPAPAANEDGLLTGLLAIVCCATLAMGLLALLGVLTGTALLAAAGAAIMVPCAWLARAPEAPFEYEYEAEDDDGGGSPPQPRDPSPMPGPDHWRPAPAPAGLFAAVPRPALVSAPAPALAPGAAFAAAVTRTALAAAPAPAATGAPAPNPRFPHLAAPAWGSGPAVAPAVTPAPFVAPAVTPPVVTAPPLPAPQPEPVFLAPASRPARGEQRSVEHVWAPAPHEIRRRRPVARLRMLHGWRRRRWFGAAGRQHASR